MNEHDTHDDAALAARLRALPRDRIPPAGSWDRIAAGIGQVPDTAPGRLRRRRPARRWWPLAGVAAALAMVATFGAGHLAEPPAPAPAATALELQAAALDRDYRQALSQLPAPAAASVAPTLVELDRSAASIRAALHEAPDAGFLLEQLQRTYALRLDLTRRAVFDAALHY